jgi:hemerythrin superfamily protein
MNFDRSDHVRLLLPDHHRRLEARCRALVESDQTGDAYALRLRWFELETELLEHLSAEEITIIPRYAIDAPDDARRILTEHAQLRELLTPIGTKDESHVQHAERVVRLVDLLDRHADHEDSQMYPWAQHNLSQVTERLLFKRVCAWFGLVHESASLRTAG